MRLKDILERLGHVRTEMRSLYDAAEQAGEDLSGDKLEKWNALEAELTDLEAKETRARQRDALDRDAPARPVGEPDELRGAWWLTREQRMADYVRANSGQSCEGLSLGRAIAAMHRGDWRNAEAEARVMGTVTNTTGGYLVPNVLSGTVIDLVRNASVLVSAGAGTIPIDTNNITIPRVTGDPTPAWRAEGQTIDESDASYGALTVVPDSLAALVRVNAELLDDVPSFASQLDGQLAAALGLKLDYAGLYGSGVSSEPLGLRDAVQTEVSMGSNGATPADYDKFLDLIAALETANGNPTTLIWSPRTKATMAKIVTGITSDKTKLVPPPDFAALRKLVSNQISVTETQGSSNAASTA